MTDIPTPEAKPAFEASTGHPREVKNILMASFVVAAVFAISNTPTPMYPQWQQGIGFSSGVLTLIFAAYIAGLLLTLVVAGQLADHFGRRKVLMPGLASALVATLLFLVADNVALLLTARFLTGVAVGVIVSAGMAAVVDAGQDTRQTMAARLASVAMVLGAGLGPLFSGLMAQFLSKPIPVIFGAEALLLLAALAVVLTQSTFSQAVRPSRKARIRFALPAVAPEFRRYIAYGVAVFGPGIAATSFVLSLGPSVLTVQLGIESPLVAGGIACAMFFMATSVQFAVAKLSIARIFSLGALSTALAMACLLGAVLAHLPWLLLCSALFSGAGQGLGQLGGLTLIAVNIPAQERAQANALMNMGGYVPAGILPLAAGFLIDILTMSSAVLIFCLTLFLAAVIGGLTVQRSIHNAQTSTKGA